MNSPDVSGGCSVCGGVEAGPTDGESGAVASCLKRRSQDGSDFRVVLSEMTRDFPLVSSDPNLEALICKEWGTSGGVRAKPSCGWLSTRTREIMVDVCSPDRLIVLRVLKFSESVKNRLWFGRRREGRYFILLKRSYVIGVSRSTREAVPPVLGDVT
ncbi:hypothetical protein F2Q70_00008104 [Brassica cretica]|uniref:Uncharacterized protein n=1 Tax=Brassica cretica TaxID=69181 RepID=A0A8S9LVN9_BRACR|nr:hypothetical protein F2Q68_00001130 [Brassica cretica]KAF2609618.1 hypothetical protein F2Q70_00008104 [Brassica cretica]